MSNEITLTLPRDREFDRVARLVLGGLALRLDLTLETLDDLQLALGAVLARPGPAAEVTIVMSVHDGTLVVRVGPVDLGDELVDGDDLNLGRVLAASVDRFDVEDDWITLTKMVGTGG